MVHLSWLMNQYWHWLTEAYTLFIFPQFLSNVLFLFQDSIQDPTLHLIFMLPLAPLGCDSFLAFLCFRKPLKFQVFGKMSLSGFFQCFSND